MSLEENKMEVAVIVTYNRKEVLAENIKMLLKQSKPFDEIIIVDNCSTDGTYDFLCKNNWTTKPFVYLNTDSNIGGAGGFHIGTKYAYEHGADWIVLMDDDGKAMSQYTFENLFIKAMQLYETNNKIFANSLVQQGDLLSFKMGNAYTVEDELKKAVDGVIYDEANPFNGTAISKELIDAIGFPNEKFFIKGDEVNYKQRAFDAGALVFTVADSRYIHPRPETNKKNILGKKVPFFVEVPWKEYYAARNFTYMYKSQKRYKAIAFELIFVKVLAILSMKCKKIKTIRMLFKGVRDGWQGKLGATVKP